MTSLITSVTKASCTVNDGAALPRWQEALFAAMAQERFARYGLFPVANRTGGRDRPPDFHLRCRSLRRIISVDGVIGRRACG